MNYERTQRRIVRLSLIAILIAFLVFVYCCDAHENYTDVADYWSNYASGITLVYILDAECNHHINYTFRSYVEQDPNIIWREGVGDCSERAVLLSAMLDHLDIPNYPMSCKLKDGSRHAYLNTPFGKSALYGIEDMIVREYKTLKVW
jgi:hypothetical protein